MICGEVVSVEGSSARVLCTLNQGHKNPCESYPDNPAGSGSTSSATTSQTDYDEFVKSKLVRASSAGFLAPELNRALFEFQRDLVRWALARGRAAIFADCGLGKTLMQLEWAHRVVEHTGSPVLIVAPLAVAQQTVAEGQKFGIDARYIRDEAEGIRDITVCNYEMLEHFSAHKYAGVVLDESSILKSYDGKTCMALIEAFAKTPYRLSCSATPAPNDFMELGTQSEFLGAMTRAEMLAMFFTHDGGETSKWRLKGHANKDFWRWVCSWAMVVRKPSDIGRDDAAFVLPALNMHSVVVPAGKADDDAGTLFAMEAQTLQERRQARGASLESRVAACAELVNATADQFIIWCNLNAEGDALEHAIPGSVQVSGSDSREHKERAALDFAAGKIRVMVSKPSIFGLGLNFQSCAKVGFVGLSDSYEQFYQAIRRCWRFGQTHEVDCYVITGEAEGAVVANIKRKEAEAKTMSEAMVEHMAAEMQVALGETGLCHSTNRVATLDMVIPGWIR